MIIIDNENVGWDAEREAGTRRTFFLNRVEFAFRYCPPGTFLMGSPEDEEERQDDETQHKVTLTRGFWLLETPVTQGMYEALTHSNPSWFSEKALGGSSPGCFSNRWEAPVEQVSWDDCQMFCRWLNAYASRVAPEGFEFRLPTEAEWEYACRAGTTGPYNVDGASLGALGWYGENSAAFSIGQTHPVRRKTPNAWGLCDMHGNVREWCADWYGCYRSTPQTDPTGPEKDADQGGLDAGLRRWIYGNVCNLAEDSYRVLRGGSWGDRGGRCRSAYRHIGKPTSRSYDAGFRVALGGKLNN